MKKSNTSIFVASLAFLATSNGLNAAEISWDPVISTKLEYNDNLLMSANNSTEVSALHITPALDFWYEQPRWQSKVGLRLNKSHYEGADGLDKTDGFFTAQFNHETTERLTTGIKGNYTKDTTLDSDFLVTGLSFNRFKRKSWDVSPSLSYVWSESISTSVEYQHSDLAFVDDISDQPFSPYTSDSVNTQLNYTLTEKDQLFTGLSYLVYSTDIDPLVSTKTSVKQPSLNFGWSHQQDENFSYSLSAGLRKTNTKLEYPLEVFDQTCTFEVFEATGCIQVASQTSNQTGYTYSGSLKKGFEISSLEFSLSQNVAPSSSGLTETTNLTSKFTRKLTEKFETIWRLSFIDSQSVLGTTNAQNTNTINNVTWFVNPEVRWHFEQDWYLGVSYRYAEQKNDASTSSQDASGNLGYLEIKYDWPKTSASR